MMFGHAAKMRQMKISLHIHPENRIIRTISAPEDEGYIVGRSDETSDFVPDIDLAKYGARELGVSRRHAALVRYQGIPHIIDLNSVNGTFWNGRRLVPDMPYPLEGDGTLRLGTLQLTFELSE
jgi:pSer/pThr/pTyr-binding forkhead associated (FHA) protein